MKSRASLRYFLAIIGSSLLAVSSASAGTFYWDANGDGTTGFGSTAGTWSSLGTGNLWSTASDGLAAVGPPATGIVTDYVTTTADSVYFGTNTNAYTGNIAISGTVNVGSIYLCPTHSTTVTAVSTPVINFAATGSFETARDTTFGLPALTITGAATSLTWKSTRTLQLFNITSSITSTPTASKYILQTSGDSLLSYPGRVAVNAKAQLGPVGTGLEFDGGTLRLVAPTAPAVFEYTSLSQLNAEHPVTFNLNKNAGFDYNVQFGTFTVDLPMNLGTGKFYAEGRSDFDTIIKLTQSNTMGGTYITSGTLEISDSAQLGAITSPLTFGTGNSAHLVSGILRITGTSITSMGGVGARPIFTTATKSVGFDIADAANTFTVDKELDQTTGTFTKRGVGTLVLVQDNTFTGATTLTGGGTLVLDYTSVSENGSRLSDSTALTLTNCDITLKNGSHPEIVSATALNGGGHSHIARDGGSSTFNMNGLTRGGSPAAGTISFSADSIATTDKTNTNGIIGGWATVGSNWAKNSTNAADGPVTALVPGDYTAFVTTGGVNTVNYQLTGGATLTGAVVSNSVRIENNANDQVLDLGTNVLSCNTNGGFIYAGGSNNKYTITGTGAAVLRNSVNTETIIHASTGTLTVNVPVSNGSGPLTKVGAGTLVLGATNTYTGSTYVNQGTLLVNGVIATSASTMTVYNKATLGGTGTIGVNTTINNGGKLEFDITTDSASHNKLELAATKTLTLGNGSTASTVFAGVTTLTITSSGGTPAAGDYVLLSAPGGIIGSVPATLNLPSGWAATVTKENSNQDLVLHVTSVGGGGYAAWKGANAGNQVPELDFDNDGVENGVEYFMNAVAGFTASPALDGTNTITWPNGGNIPASAYGTGAGKQFVIQTSSDLSTWNDVSVGSLTTNTNGPGGSLTYTLTGAAPRFVRLKVTPE